MLRNNYNVEPVFNLVVILNEVLSLNAQESDKMDDELTKICPQ